MCLPHNLPRTCASRTYYAINLQFRSFSLEITASRPDPRVSGWNPEDSSQCVKCACHSSRRVMSSGGRGNPGPRGLGAFRLERLALERGDTAWKCSQASHTCCSHVLHSMQTGSIYDSCLLSWTQCLKSFFSFFEWLGEQANHWPKGVGPCYQVGLPNRWVPQIQKGRPEPPLLLSDTSPHTKLPQCPLQPAVVMFSGGTHWPSPLSFSRTGCPVSYISLPLITQETPDCVEILTCQVSLGCLSDLDKDVCPQGTELFTHSLMIPGEVKKSSSTPVHAILESFTDLTKFCSSNSNVFE